MNTEYIIEDNEEVSVSPEDAIIEYIDDKYHYRFVN